MDTEKKERIESKKRGTLNASIAAETLRDLRIFAANTNRTVGAALDFCIRDAIHAWKNAEADTNQLERDNQ